MRAVEQPKRVVVVGGGPAGMETARVAASRGHKVILFERDARLGGQLNLACVPPGRADFAELPAWLTRQLQLLGVGVRLGVEANVDAILAERPDVVVVATGSRPVLHEIEGQDGRDSPRVGSVADALTGKLELGRRVILVDDDGHYKAAATSEWLVDQGCEVIHVTPRTSLGPEVPGPSIVGVNQRLRGKGVQIRICQDVRRFEGSTVVLADTYSGAEEAVPDVDAVVMATRNQAVDDLYHALEGGSVQEIYVVGDASAPRLAIEAMHEAHRIGRLI